jgi:hypothetical protein
MADRIAAAAGGGRLSFADAWKPGRGFWSRRRESSSVNGVCQAKTTTSCILDANRGIQQFNPGNPAVENAGNPRSMPFCEPLQDRATARSAAAQAGKFATKPAALSAQKPFFACTIPHYASYLASTSDKPSAIRNAIFRLLTADGRSLDGAIRRNSDPVRAIPSRPTAPPSGAYAPGQAGTRRDVHREGCISCGQLWEVWRNALLQSHRLATLLSNAGSKSHYTGCSRCAEPVALQPEVKDLARSESIIQMYCRTSTHVVAARKCTDGAPLHRDRYVDRK